MYLGAVINVDSRFIVWNWLHRHAVSLVRRALLGVCNDNNNDNDGDCDKEQSMMNQLRKHQLEQHVTILGWLHIAGNLFFVLIGLFVYFFLSTIGVVTGDEQAVVILGVVATFVGGLLLVLGLPGIVAGIGLLAHKAWARYLAIVLAVLNLLNFPVGTVIGAYTLWVLMQEEAVPFFGAEPSSAPSTLAHR